MKTYRLNKLFQFLFPFFFIVGIILLAIGFDDKRIINLSCEPNNSISYKVYLKENNFFEEPYLEEGRTYIASLIDYIDVNFNYSMKYDIPVNGNYDYKYIAVVSANKKNSSGYYWQKEYDLSEEKHLDLNDSTAVSMGDRIKVDYDKYNTILGEFKKEYGVNTDGELKVVMRVTNKATFEEIDKPLEVDSEISLSIPLMEQALELSINKDDANAKSVIEVEDRYNSIEHVMFKILGFFLVLLSIIGFIDALRYNRKFKKKNEYELALDKILKNYDSIIANVSDLSNVEELKQIKVKEFQELLDVYNEVRMPINYYQDKSKAESTFAIINDGIAWIYVLKKDDFTKRVDK